MATLAVSPKTTPPGNSGTGDNNPGGEQQGNPQIQQLLTSACFVFLAIEGRRSPDPAGSASPTNPGDQQSGDQDENGDSSPRPVDPPHETDSPRPSAGASAGACAEAREGTSDQDRSKPPGCYGRVANRPIYVALAVRAPIRQVRACKTRC